MSLVISDYEYDSNLAIHYITSSTGIVTVRNSHQVN